MRVQHVVVGFEGLSRWGFSEMSVTFLFILPRSRILRIERASGGMACFGTRCRLDLVGRDLSDCQLLDILDAHHVNLFRC